MPVYWDLVVMVQRINLLCQSLLALKLIHHCQTSHRLQYHLLHHCRYHWVVTMAHLPCESQEPMKLPNETQYLGPCGRCIMIGNLPPGLKNLWMHHHLLQAMSHLIHRRLPEVKDWPHETVLCLCAEEAHQTQCNISYNFNL